MTSGEEGGMSFKGPHHPFPILDEMMCDILPNRWNNVPLPVVDAVRRILDCLVEVKKEMFINFNNNVRLYRDVTINRNSVKGHMKALKKEIMDDYFIYIDEL